MYKNDQLILKGNRNCQDGLWDISITKKSIIDDNYYSILSQAQHQDNIALQPDSISSDHNTVKNINTTSPQIMPSFLNHLSIVAGENIFHNELDHFKN